MRKKECKRCQPPATLAEREEKIDMDNPYWYCKEVESRAIRDKDKFEVGCDQCGYRTTTYDRRWPRDEYIEYILSKGCTCD